MEGQSEDRDELEALAAEFAELTSAREVDAAAGLDGPELELSTEELDVEAEFAAMMAGAAAGQTDGGLVFVHDTPPTDPEPTNQPSRAVEASDTDEMADSTDGALERDPQVWIKGTLVDIETGDGWERGVVVLGPAESSGPHYMRVRFPDGSVEDWETADFVARDLAGQLDPEHAGLPAVVNTIVLGAARQAVMKRRAKEVATAVEPGDQAGNVVGSNVINVGLTAALAEAEATAKMERLSASKVAEELQTLRTAYADTLAELHQVTEQYARELAKRTSTILDREATITLLQEQHDTGSAAQQPPHETDCAQEAERLRAQLATIKAEAAHNAAKAREADAKCVSLMANLAAADETIRCLQVSSQSVDVSVELVHAKAALAAEAEARKAEKDAYASIAATYQTEKVALAAEYQVEMQRERHRAQQTIHSLQSAISISTAATSIPVDVDSKIEASKTEQLRLKTAVEAVSVDAGAQQRAFVELQHAHRKLVQEHSAMIKRTRRVVAETAAEHLGEHWMDAEVARVIELGIVEAVCEAETHEKTKHGARQPYSSEQLNLQETLAAQVTAIEDLRQDLEATKEELAATIETAKAEKVTAAAKFASKEAELALAMAKLEGELGVVATERNAALQAISSHEQRLAEKEADFARAAQEEIAALHTKLKLSDQRLDRVSRHTATLVQKARAEEKAAWTEEKTTLTARLKAQQIEIDHVLTVKISSLQEQVASTVAAVETRASGVELALRERLEQAQCSAQAAKAVADAEISRLTGLLATAERTLLARVPTLEGALSNAEREVHAARAAHASDRAEVLDQHAAAIAAAEQAKSILLQESTERISAVLTQASESNASLSSEMALKASQWDEERKRMTALLDTISSKLDALQAEYDKETAAHKKCQVLLADKERAVANQEEAVKHMGALLRKAIDEKTASSTALAEQTAAWSAIRSGLTRERDVALKECDGLVKRLKHSHAEQLAEVNARAKEELAFAKFEQEGLRARLGQKDLTHSKAVADLEATVRTLVHERDMARAELQRRNSNFGKERQKLMSERDASRMQADEAEVSNALAAQQLYDIATELAQERVESRRAQHALTTEMLQSEHRLRSLLVESEREKQKWSELILFHSTTCPSELTGQNLTSRCPRLLCSSLGLLMLRGWRAVPNISSGSQQDVLLKQSFARLVRRPNFSTSLASQRRYSTARVPSAQLRTRRIAVSRSKVGSGYSFTTTMMVAWTRTREYAARCPN